MRSPVYRNLDRPFQIYGFSPFELAVLVAVFVAGGELAQAIALSRGWAFAVAALLALTMFTLRRSLGNGFSRRLWRFLCLPSTLHPKLFRLRRAA
jgi:hypothetical protein